MKVLKRVFAIAISLAAIAMATSAFAADATYNAGDETITLPDAAITAIEGMTGQVTMAVVPETFGSTTTASTDIYYINQGTAADMADVAASIGLKDGLSVPANYQVRVGGEGVSYTAYDIPEVAFTSASAADTSIEGRVGIAGTIQVNAGITALKVLLKDGDVVGSYNWTEGLNIASVNGATFTFGLEIINNTDDAAKDMSGITITGVEMIPAN